MTDPIYDADLLWLRENYLDEMPNVEWIIEPGEFALEMGAARGGGLYHKWTNRIAGDSFMDEYRRTLLPFHEAVKRLGPIPERRWLRYALNWRGLPCLCAHRAICDHLAALDLTTSEAVMDGIRYATRSVLTKLDQFFDIRRGPRTVRVGRQSVRIFTPTDTDGASVIPGQDLGSNARGIGTETPAQKKIPGYICRTSGQWVSSCNCPPFDLDDIRAAA